MIQKVIKVGGSVAVTIPAKEAKRLHLEPGASVEVAFKPPRDTLRRDYEAFKARYDETLKNLSKR